VRTLRFTIKPAKKTTGTTATTTTSKTTTTAGKSRTGKVAKH
jgi:hypothetical protein